MIKLYRILLMFVMASVSDDIFASSVAQGSSSSASSSSLRTIEIIHAVAQRAHDPVLLKSFYQSDDWIEFSPDFNIIQFNVTCKDPINYALDYNGSTIVKMAAHWNRVEDLKLLLNAYNANIDAQDTCGENALHESVKDKSHSACAQLLIDRGANINKTNQAGSSVLDEAFRFDNMSGVELLLANGVRYQYPQAFNMIYLATYLRQTYKVCIMMYYLRAEDEKPTRQKYNTDELFQDKLHAWNKRMERLENVRTRSLMESFVPNLDAFKDHMSADQIKRCDEVIAQRTQLLGGGNIMQLLRQREQGTPPVALLKRRLLHRATTLEEPRVEVGDIIAKQ